MRYVGHVEIHCLSTEKIVLYIYIFHYITLSTENDKSLKKVRLFQKEQLVSYYFQDREYSRTTTALFSHMFSSS